MKNFVSLNKIKQRTKQNAHIAIKFPLKSITLWHMIIANKHASNSYEWMPGGVKDTCIIFGKEF